MNEKSIRYLNNASLLYQSSNTSKGTKDHSQIYSSYISKKKRQRLQDLYPGLLKELNSSDPHYPVYMRFQK